MLYVAQAQTLTLNGVVSGARGQLDSVQIDLYEYNSPILSTYTDRTGAYTISLRKGKEYLLVYHRLGYKLASVSVTDYVDNQIANYTLNTYLTDDSHPPDGLYFSPPLRRIAPGSGYMTFTEIKFDVDRIKPKHRGDSVRVLLNRAQANQYIAMGAIKLQSTPTDVRYSQQAEQSIRIEVSRYGQQMRQSQTQIEALIKAETIEVQAANITRDDTQLDHLTAAQKVLAERLAEKSSYYLYLQQQHLAQARLYDIDALKYKQLMETAVDTDSRVMTGLLYWRAKAGATNERYLALDANKRFLLHNKYQKDQYQEYIELLRYKERKKDTIPPLPTPSPVVKAKPKPLEPKPTIDTTDRLSAIPDEARTVLIQKALEEEERFKNYTETTTTLNDLLVKTIHIGDDTYEMQIDKKGASRYLKNNKAVTKITYEFETKRKLIDVLNTIRQVDKFGK
jgi:hypothetical protein